MTDRTPPMTDKMLQGRLFSYADKFGARLCSDLRVTSIMTSVLVIAPLLVAIPIPARAATPTDLPAPALPESLDATRHHQPTNEHVTHLENERYGRQKVEEQQRREKSEVDQLYDEVMGLSAPVLNDPPPKPGS